METTFLVIDDSYIDRLVAGMLIKRAFDVSDVAEMKGGNEALAWLANYKSEKPLVILLDIMMPHMNGFEFLEKFEQLAEGIVNNTTIFMLSSTLDYDDMMRAENHPLVEKLLSKPLSEKQLKQLVTSAFKPAPRG